MNPSILDDSRFPRGFATTRWGVVRAAAGEGQAAFSALESLCRDYWAPVHTHVLHRVSDPHLAEDLTQEFFSKFLSQGWFLRPREERGKFRTFLLVVLKRFLADEFQRGRTWKRGGRTVIVRLEDAPEIPGPDDPDSSLPFDRAWARTLLDRAFVSLRRETDPARFEQLSPFLEREPAHGEYQRIAGSWGVTPNSLAAAVLRLRRRLRELLREEVRQTLDDEQDVEDELRHLTRLLVS